MHASIPPPRSEETIAKSKAELVDWEKRYRADWEFVRWPVRSSSAGKFLECWNGAFTPLRTWVAEAALCVAAEVQRDFRDFRVERGLVTYPDQVALADELLQHPSAARRLREENFRVILDEAQDTDPAQFSVLTEITRPTDATGRWLETETRSAATRPFLHGRRFPAIDLSRPRRFETTTAPFTGPSSAATPPTKTEFSVTFRLDQKQLKFVNDTFGKILNEKDGQVKFVTLQPRPDVLPGQVIRVSLGADLLPVGEKPKDYQKARIEADALAAWIEKTGLEKLAREHLARCGDSLPAEVWLRTLATALRRLGCPPPSNRKAT